MKQQAKIVMNASRKVLMCNILLDSKIEQNTKGITNKLIHNKGSDK